VETLESKIVAATQQKTTLFTLFTFAENWNQCRIAAFEKGPARDGSVSKADEYQRLATECLRLAHTASDQTNRAVLLQMAQSFLKLAERELENKARSGPSD